MQSLTLLNNQYRIIKQLGEGGFGKTYLAEDTHMPSGRHCVIKQLKPDAENSQIYQLIQERFQREAAILEDLGKGHPQIPTLYGYFREADKFYLVQELIEGQTLTQKIHISGVMSESSVKLLLSELLPVFDYVHTRRIVHRDVKPDNILIRVSDNLPVLIDFGAVRETMGTVVNSQGQSTSSIVIGTPGYMPSEQAAGRPRFSSDLYALGLTAIYLLTGKIPQQLETDPQTGEILWRHYALSVSPTFGCVIDRAIMSHPRDRFSSAKEMLQAIQSGMNFPVASVPPPVTSPSPPLPPTAMSYPPTGMGIVTPLPETEVSNRPIQYPTGGSKDWQKAAIIGGMIGLSTIVGLVLTRPNAAVSPPVSEENKTEEKTETPKENSVPPSTNSISTQPVSASTTTSTSPTTASTSNSEQQPSPPQTQIPNVTQVESTLPSTKSIENNQGVGWIRIGAVENSTGTLLDGVPLIATSQPVTIQPTIVPQNNSQVTILTGVNLRTGVPEPPNYDLKEKISVLPPGIKVIVLQKKAFLTPNNPTYPVVWAEVRLP